MVVIDTDNVSGWTTVRPRITTVATRRPRPIITIPSIPDFRKRLVFDGNGWIAYDFYQLPANYLGRSDEERLAIKFQTSHPEGLLWYTGDEDNNMHLTIKVCNNYTLSGTVLWSILWSIAEATEHTRTYTC